VSRIRRFAGAVVATCAASIMLAAPAQADAIGNSCTDHFPGASVHQLEGHAAYTVDGTMHNWYLFLGKFGGGFASNLDDENNLDIWFHRNGVQMFHEWDSNVPAYNWFGWGANHWTQASDHEVVRWQGVFDLPGQGDTHCNAWAET
jgi:hypothetical protein